MYKPWVKLTKYAIFDKNSVTIAQKISIPIYKHGATPNVTHVVGLCGTHFGTILLKLGIGYSYL